MNTNEVIKIPRHPHFQVTAIGSSAAEIDILKKIVSDFALDSGRAYLIFENLSSPQTPNLADELASITTIPVIEIVHHIDILPDHIYVIPENNFLVQENGILSLKPKTRSSKLNNSFDLFFEAVGQAYKSYVVGVILTWTPLDGSAGLKRLKEAGGFTIATLSKRGVLQNDVSSEYIDYFAAPHEIADKLSQIHQSSLVTHSYEEKEESTASEQELLHQITEILLSKTGTDFQQYKQTTLLRRLTKRMVETRQETVEKYVFFLRNNTKEQELLFNDFLISVTYFFRDPDVFNTLSKTIIPLLIENAANNTLRIWSAGCSTGEEAYSLAICIHEYLEEINRNDIKVQIIASDLSEKCISKARLAIYTAQDVKSIDEKRLEKYFTKRDNGFHINKIIRDMCVFAVHDLTKDAPFAKIDFVCCRNVLIYFDTDLQNQVLALFHYALRENGYLFIGKSEWTYHVPHLFTAVDKLDKIYSRKPITTFQSQKTSHHDDHHNFIIREHTRAENDYRKIASDMLLEHFLPAAVLINEAMEIVHFHGDTSPFLQPASGKPSFNILNMVRDEISAELKNYILKTRDEKKNFSGEFATVKKQPFLTSFEIIYLPNHPELLLIIFCKKTITSKDTGNHHSEDMEKELVQLREDFKRVTEDQLIYFEELQTTNEELISANEELQTINQQLENSTRELRSNNQELSVVNDELREHRHELMSLRNFYESIINIIKQPFLIVDQSFIIKSANPAFYSFFKTTAEQTEGYSIVDIGNSHWNIPLFIESILKKANRNEIVENFKIQFDFDEIGKKTMLLTTALLPNSSPNQLILIVLEDITDLEESNESIKNKNQELLNFTKQLEAFTEAASQNLLEPGRKIYMFGKKVLDTESLTELGKHNLTRLLNSAVNLNLMIEDLIDYSRINFTKKTFKNTDLNVLIKRTVNELKAIIGKHHAEIHFDSLPTLSVIPAQIQKLFTHLITNSIKYTQKEIVPQIDISTKETSLDELQSLGADPSVSYIKVTVKDNGVGFNKDYETLIFDPFYKLHSNEQHYGSGLGLTLVQKIVANHRGFIRVSSEPFKGTTVCIYLPQFKIL